MSIYVTSFMGNLQAGVHALREAILFTPQVFFSMA
jgi:hypothetical protein